MIELACAECGAKLRISEEHIGRTGRCPKCQAHIRIERTHTEALKPGAAVQERPAEPSAVPPARPAPPLLPAAPAGPAGAALTIGQLRDKRENTAKGCLIALAVPAWLLLAGLIVGSFGIVLILAGLVALAGLIARGFLLAYVKTNAVRVSGKQFPEIHAAAQRVCARLKVPVPEVYVLQESTWNAFAAKLVGKRVVVLLSGAIDSILLKGDMSQLTWLVGHEIGHHVAGHFGFFHDMLMLGAWLPVILLWYKRRGELTCDRVGLYGANSLSSSLAALCNMTVGAQLAEKLNVDEAIQQWRSHKGEFLVHYRTIYSTHPHNLWRLENLVQSAMEFRIAE